MSALHKVALFLGPALLGLCSLLPQAASAQVVYNQPAVFPGTTSFSSWTSDHDTTTGGFGIIYNTYDNFTLASAALIKGLTWQGFTFDSNALNGTVTTPSSFTIQFLSDSGGVPGSTLSVQQVAYTSTPVGTVDFFSNGGSETVYNYSATLPAVFGAAANTPLWVSITGNTAYPAFWTWTQGTGGDNQSYQSDYYDANSGPRSGDRAFTLTAAPEPSQTDALFLGTLTLTGMTLKARRRRAIAA